MSEESKESPERVFIVNEDVIYKFEEPVKISKLTVDGDDVEYVFAREDTTGTVKLRMEEKGGMSLLRVDTPLKHQDYFRNFYENHKNFLEHFARCQVINFHNGLLKKKE
jgi:hypothetical protein